MRHVSIPAGLILAMASAFSAAAQQPPSMQPVAAAAPAPVVRLLEPGAAPRQTLRLTPQPGTAGGIDLTMLIKARQSVDGAGSPEPPTPGVLMSFATVVTDVKDDRISYTFECVKADLIDDPAVPPAIADIMRGGIKMVVGLHGTGELTGRGRSVRVNVTRTPDMDESILAHALAIEQLLEQVTTPLPAEPVGVGGRWEISNTVDQDGLAIQETITCTLAASTGNTIEIAMDIKRHADPQPVHDPSMPVGATASLSSYSFDGTGRAVFVLDKLHATEAAVNIATETTMQMDFGDVHHEITQDLTIDTHLQGK